MKKFRPYRAGFIVLYVLSLLCTADAVYSLVGQATGSANSLMSSFSVFSYLIALLAILYTKMYISTRVEIGGGDMHIVFPVYIKPAPGAKRAMFIYRQGETDLKLVDKHIQLDGLEKYGYIEDLGYKQLDQSNAGPNNKLFPVHEIAFVMKDGKRYHLNGAFYSRKQLGEMMRLVRDAVGFEPEGALAEILRA